MSELDSQFLISATGASIYPSARVPVPYSETSNSLAWQRFLSGEARSRLLARSEVIDSWERCRHSHVDLRVDAAPRVEDDAVAALRRVNHDLLQASAATLAESGDRLADTRMLMLLTDAFGVVLDSVGDIATVHAGRNIALARGGDWRETGAGTNGIGTALETRRPVMVHAGEHYCEGIKGWSCAGAPIHDPVDGSVAGILGISAKKQESSAQILSLAVFAAQSIEQQLLRQAEARRIMLLEMGLEHGQRHAGDGLIAVDAKGRIAYISRLAQQMLHDRFDGRVPELKRGMRLLGDPAVEGSGLITDLPLDWLRPLRAAGELSGHLIVIPSSSAPRQLVPAKPAVEDTDIERSQFDCIVGVSDGLQSAINQARQIAGLDVSVLIEGETGVGKELFARAIHGQSAVARGPFVAFNCGAVSKDMIASELFGYAKGAFTGASPKGRIGRFEQADGGTLCLDEIGELQLDLQPYLLRILEEGIVYRVGENAPRRVNVRVLAMTNRDLRAEVAAGRFRLDLYHRLSVASIEVPPLRDRPGDLQLLIDYFNPRIADRHHRDPVRFTPRAVELLAAHSWPGNIRELRNVVERSILFATDGVADVACLPRDIAGSPTESPPVESPVAESPAAAANPVRPDVGVTDEHAVIDEAMELSGGNLSVTASVLGISRSTLYRKMAVHGMKRISPISRLRHRLSDK